MAVPATVDVKQLNATFRIQIETKFFPHISMEAPPVEVLVNGVEEVITSSLNGWMTGIEELKSFLTRMRSSMSLNLYSIELSKS